MIDIFKIILQHELKINLQSKGRIIANILYFLIFLSIFQILIQNLDKNNDSQLFVISVILAIFLSVICINNGLLEQDNRDGTLEQMLIHCPNLEIYFFAKCFANWLLSCVIIIICACLFSQIINTEILEFWKLFLILSLSSLALNFLLAFCGAISILGNLSSIILVLAMPLALPILILATITMVDFAENILILLALTIFTISTSTLAGAKIIRISNN